MTNIRYTLPIPILLFIALILTQPIDGLVGNSSIYDDLGNRYSSFGEAVREASPGSTIYVVGGVHRGGIVIDKPLSLVGMDRPVLDGGYNGSVVTIENARNVSIIGFRNERSGRVYSTEDSGIKIINSSGVVIRDNVFDDVFFGILVKDSRGVEIVGNSITGIEEYYLSDRMHGIYNWYSYNISIINNTFRYVKDGVYNDHNYDTVIANNTFRYGRYGVHLMYSDRFVIEGNDISGFIAGMALMYSENLTVRFNRIHGNRVGGIGEGLFIPETDNILIEHNWIVGNVVGINIRYTPYTPGKYSIIRFNVIAYNYVGLHVDTDSEAEVYGNDFIENVQEIRYIGYTKSRIKWYSEELRIGNYWSGVKAFDSDGDGLVDVPYTLVDPLYRFIREHRELSVYYLSPVYEVLDIVFKYSYESPLQGLIEDPYPLREPYNIDRLDLILYIENLPYTLVLTLIPIYIVYRGVYRARGKRG